MADEADWLPAKMLNCLNCGTSLYRVAHSPFYDSHYLRCNHCPRMVEMNYYDPIYGQLCANLQDIVGSKFQAIMHAIELRLKPCLCGGHFHANAARRCYVCAAEVFEDNTGDDLWPSIYGLDPENEDITSEDFEAGEAEVLAFQEEFVLTQDIWL